MLSKRIINASAVSINGLGFLILGRSGSGKSELALGLIKSGAKLIADDRVVITSSELSPKHLKSVLGYIVYMFAHGRPTSPMRCYPEILLKPHPEIHGLLHSRQHGFLCYDAVEAPLAGVIFIYKPKAFLWMLP